MVQRDAAWNWCQMASDHAKSYGGKRWEYVLIPQDVIAENMTLALVASAYGASTIRLPSA